MSDGAILLASSVVFLLLAILARMQVRRGWPRGNTSWHKQKRAVMPKIVYLCVAVAVVFFTLGTLLLVSNGD